MLEIPCWVKGGMAMFERQVRGPGSLLGDRASIMRKDPSLWVELNRMQ